METKARAIAWNKQAAIEQPKPGPQTDTRKGLVLSATIVAKVIVAPDAVVALEAPDDATGPTPPRIVPMRVPIKATIAKANRVVPQQGVPQLAKLHRSESMRMKVISPKTETGSKGESKGL